MCTGAPMVRFGGSELALLTSIRDGQRSFEEILGLAEELLADCERLKATADLPDVCDAVRATALLRELTAHWESRTP